MILPFSTQLNGKSTYFVDKIWSGLIAQKLATIETCRRYEYNREKVTPKDFAIVPHYSPKLHTIREDKNDRWKVGTNINFYINCRQKNMFRFAPVLPVVSIQKIEIRLTEFMDEIITIDNRRLNLSEMQQLARNDGFENLCEFIDFFNEDFTGKIIHWTDYIY